MVFEVKATHRVVATGEMACEVHPDVFVDEAGRVLSTGPGAGGTDTGRPTGLVALAASEEAAVLVVEDEVVEFVVDWINVLSGDARQGADGTTLPFEVVAPDRVGRGCSSRN